MFSCGEEAKETQDNHTEKTEEVAVTKDPAEEASDLKDLEDLDSQRIKNDLSIDLNIAKSLYTRSIAFSKNYPNSKHLEKVLTYAYKGAENIGDYEEAVEILHQLAHNVPNAKKIPVHMYNKGKVLEEKMGKIEASKAAYKELIKKYPRNPFSKDMKTYISKGIIDMTAEEKVNYYKEMNQE